MLGSSDLWCGEWFTAKARVFKPEQNIKEDHQVQNVSVMTGPPTRKKRFAQGAVQEDVFSRRLIIY